MGDGSPTSAKEELFSRVIGRNMMQKGGNPVPSCIPVSERHEHPDPLALRHCPLLADCLDE